MQCKAEVIVPTLRKSDHTRRIVVVVNRAVIWLLLFACSVGRATAATAAPRREDATVHLLPTKITTETPKCIIMLISLTP